MFAYRVKVKGQWREFDFRPIAEVPEEILLTGTPESQVWALLSWGLLDPKQMDALDAMPMRHIWDMIEFWEADSHITITEIRSVIATANEHRGPLEADLIKLGLRLRDCPSERFNWRDLWIIITYADVYTNIVAADAPERAGWGKLEMLMADVADNTDWLVWAKTKDAQERGATPPDRRPRPGVKPPEVRAGSKVKPVPISRIREIYKLDERHAQQDQLARQRQLESVFR
jgi:hypothetical protein